KTSLRSSRRPVTRVISLPSFSSRRSCSGSTMVGTCASRPAPTISPMVAPSLRGGDGVLQVAVEVEAPGAALAADAGLARAAEERAQVPYEEAVDPDGPGDQPGGDERGPLAVAGGDGGGQAGAGVVGQPDGLVLGVEGLERQHRAEDLLLDDLAVLGDVREQGRLVVQALAALAADDGAGARGQRPPDEAVD